MDSSAVAGRPARLLGLADVEPVAGGLEFAVFRAVTSDGEQRAPRVRTGALRRVRELLDVARSDTR